MSLGLYSILPSSSVNVDNNDAPSNVNHIYFMLGIPVGNVRPQTVTLGPMSGRRYQSLQPHDASQPIGHKVMLGHKVQIHSQCRPREATYRRGSEDLIRTKTSTKYSSSNKITTILDNGEFKVTCVKQQIFSSDKRSSYLKYSTLVGANIRNFGLYEFLRKMALATVKLAAVDLLSVVERIRTHSKNINQVGIICWLGQSIGPHNFKSYFLLFYSKCDFIH